jgi:hypothetical protein
LFSSEVFILPPENDAVLFNHALQQKELQMNMMNIPGFTADAALNHTSGQYRFAAGTTDMPGGSVIPQRIKLREWTCECDAATDICVCTSGGAMRVIHAVLGEI